MAAAEFRSSVFRDTDLNNRLLSILNEQRATSRFCDVILKVMDDHIYAHSNVLAAACPYFGTLLGLGSDSPRAFSEKNPQVIEIQIDHMEAGAAYVDALRHVVEYMYTCTLELNSGITSHIAEIANIIKLQRVLDYCDRFWKGETGVTPTDKRGVSLGLHDFGPSKRVRKNNASTETEFAMFEKSSGLSTEDLQEEIMLSLKMNSHSIAMCAENKSTQQMTVEVADSQGGSCISVPQNPTEKGTQLDSGSLPSSQEKSSQGHLTSLEKVNEVAFANADDAPNIMVVKNEDGTLTAAVAVPFISVPLPDACLPLSSVPKQEEESEAAQVPASVEIAESNLFTLSETILQPKVPAIRGRKRGRPRGRGRGLKRLVREVFSDSEPELVAQEPDNNDVAANITSASHSEAIPATNIVDVDGIAENLLSTSQRNPEPEEEGLKGTSDSDQPSSQDQASASTSATETSVSAESGGVIVKEEVTVKQEAEVNMSRTRGRKPITSFMASWTSPRRRAGIPRSVYRSDYVMHSLIRRSRHSSASNSPGAFREDSSLENEMDEDEEAESCEALAKDLGEAGSGMESTIKFVCQTCDFATVSFRLYRQHMKSHPETDTRSYTCTECNFHTTKARQLLLHRKKHLHEDLICSYCEIQLDTAEKFELHLQRHAHNLPFFCHSCDMRFKTRTQLNTHLPKHRTEKPFVCQICGNGFKWKHALKSHMVTHSATKDHLCDICGFATAHKSQLKAHRLIHTGDTFKCPEPGCNFEATKRQNLKYHMVTHTQEKAHQCEVCGQAFSLIKNMRRHMLLHSETRPYHCSVCAYTSTRYDKLKEHKLKQHNLGLPPGKKVGYTTYSVNEDGTMVQTGLTTYQMIPSEPIIIMQGGNKITITTEVTLTDEALQTIAQIATSSAAQTLQDGSQPQEAQINMATSEGIPIIARVQFGAFSTTESIPDDPTQIINYDTQVQD